MPIIRSETGRVDHSANLSLYNTGINISLMSNEVNFISG